MKIEEIVEQLQLKPHPEGGFYRETYRSTEGVNSKGRDRNLSTCIYFLIRQGNFSAFHRLASDEIWHFYHGSTITLHEIQPDGSYTNTKIGSDVLKGERPQYVIGSGKWFAAEIERDGYALIGCTVSPGFDFEDFELADRQDLIRTFPQHSGLIERLTRLQN